VTSFAVILRPLDYGTASRGNQSFSHLNCFSSVNLLLALASILSLRIYNPRIEGATPIPRGCHSPYPLLWALRGWASEAMSECCILGVGSVSPPHLITSTRCLLRVSISSINLFNWASSCHPQGCTSGCTPLVWTLFPYTHPSFSQGVEKVSRCWRLFCRLYCLSGDLSIQKRSWAFRGFRSQWRLCVISCSDENQPFFFDVNTSIRQGH
jgi:hypothetical protein